LSGYRKDREQQEKEFGPIEQIDESFIPVERFKGQFSPPDPTAVNVSAMDTGSVRLPTAPGARLDPGSPSALAFENDPN
jgi:hypothetical protein